MKIMKNISIILILATLSEVAFSQQTQDLTGDKRLACEAILCLSSAERPKECSKALKKYYSIKKRRSHKTISARKKFLKLCPVSSDNNSNMDNIINTITKNRIPNTN